MKRSRLAMNLLLVLLVGVVGCSGKAARRPQPGDHLTPEMKAPVAWRAAGLATLTVRIKVQGPNETHSVWLQDDEATPDMQGLATIIFYEGDQPLAEPVEAPLLHDC